MGGMGTEWWTNLGKCGRDRSGYPAVQRGVIAESPAPDATKERRAVAQILKIIVLHIKRDNPIAIGY
jgi:hypothetical protein